MDGWQRAFVLHSRPWSETSLMLDVFTEESGRVRLVAKGARSKRSNLKGALQPFTPCWFASAGAAKSKPCAARKPFRWRCRSAASPSTAVSTLTSLSPACWSTKHVSPNSFRLSALHSGARRGQRLAGARAAAFELALLGHLGYGVDFLHCAGSGEPVDDTMTYRYREEKGFIASLVIDNNTFTGHHLKALASREFPDVDTLRAARFTRIALKPYLGGKPLKSRELFRQFMPARRREPIIRIMINEDCHG